MISKEVIEKFKSLYQKKYDVVLTDEEATEMTTSFLNLMRVLIYPKSKPSPIESYQEGEETSETSRL